VHDLNAAAAKAQKALADLRIATDEATDNLGGRIARAREIGERLDTLVARAQAAPARREPEGGLSALISALKDEAEPTLPRIIRPPERTASRPVRSAFDDDLFEDAGARA